MEPVTLAIDDLSVLWLVHERRIRKEIVVERDGTLQVRSSPHESETAVRAFVQSKKFWIYQRLAERDRLNPLRPPREFVEGEGFLYLGRSYRLSLRDLASVPLAFEGNRFYLNSAFRAEGKRHFVEWYTAQGLKHLGPLTRRFATRLGEQPRGFRVQDLGYRWASCGVDRVLYFHWRAMMLPMSVLEYLVAHEVAHLREHNHTPAFWALLESLYPGYQAKKTWLAENGAKIDL